jgi:hypothetical protein
LFSAVNVQWTAAVRDFRELSAGGIRPALKNRQVPPPLASQTPARTDKKSWQYHLFNPPFRSYFLELIALAHAAMKSE